MSCFPPVYSKTYPISKRKMPITSKNVFQEIPDHVNKTVNPYVDMVRAAAANGSLPLRYGPYLKDSKGYWREKLNLTKASKLTLEVGCHNGLVLSSLAKLHPDSGFIGMDITFKRVIQTAEKLHSSSSRNGLSVLANAAGISEIFDYGELDLVIIFFPDPWCKKKGQTKKRLVQEEFCTSLFDTLSAEGQIWFKTDHLPYFEDVCQLMSSAGFNKSLRNPNWLSDIPPSSFETRFTKEGLPFYSCTFHKSLKSGSC